MLEQSIFAFALALALTVVFTRKIIAIAISKYLFDEVSESRKIHKSRTPNFGGVAIYTAVLFTTCLFYPGRSIPNFNIILACSIILFVVGITDDISGVSPARKIIAQLTVAILTIFIAGYRITNLYGFLGIHTLPYTVSVIITSLFIIFLINAINLVDGINWLAGAISLLSIFFFAYFFGRIGSYGYFTLCVTIAGSLLAFLYFNKTPAKIFMGDTGSLLLGYIIAVLAIQFIELSHLESVKKYVRFALSAPAIVFALLIVPIFDTIRVFSLRILKGRSPFRADRGHIHHRLIDLNFTHLQSTGILILVSIASLTISLTLYYIKIEYLLLIIIIFTLFLNQLSIYLVGKGYIKSSSAKNKVVKKAVKFYEDNMFYKKLYSKHRSGINDDAEEDPDDSNLKPPYSGMVPDPKD